MKQDMKTPTVRSVYAVTSIAMIVAGLMAVSACSSNSGSKALGERAVKEDSESSAGNSATPAKADPGINLAPN